MSFEQKISQKTATVISPKRPSYGIGFSGIKGLVPAGTSTRWFARTAFGRTHGSKEVSHS